MGINYRRLRSLPARDLVSALMRDGFALDRQAGSHQHYRHPDGRRVTVTFHAPSDTFGVRLLKYVLEDQARWTADDLRRLGLIKGR